MRYLGVVAAGVISYQDGLALQETARNVVETGEVSGVLLFVEHTPVITIGRAGGGNNIRKPELFPKVLVVETDRGGNITCHNPGQIVGYPVLNLRYWQQDLHWYVYALEETLIRSLARIGLKAGRKAKYTGVWLANEKIAAIGVSAKQWITGHGFALNVDNDLRLFDSIVPCGIHEFGVTSVFSQGIDSCREIIMQIIAEEFSAIFNCKLAFRNLEWLSRGTHGKSRMAEPDEGKRK